MTCKDGLSANGSERERTLPGQVRELAHEAYARMSRASAPIRVGKLARAGDRVEREPDDFLLLPPPCRQETINLPSPLQIVRTAASRQPT